MGYRGSSPSVGISGPSRGQPSALPRTPRCIVNSRSRFLIWQGDLRRTHRKLALADTISEHDDLCRERLGVLLERDQVLLDHVLQIGDGFLTTLLDADFGAEEVVVARDGSDCHGNRGCDLTGSGGRRVGDLDVSSSEI